MMQPTPAIDPQQQQWMMMQRPPQAGFWPQQPQFQLQQTQLMMQQTPQQFQQTQHMVQQYPQQFQLQQPQHMVQQYHQQFQHQQQYTQQVSFANEISTLWIGGLQNWMDENYLYRCFAPYTKSLISINIIRNRQTKLSEGYGFLEFVSHAAAQMALQNYNGLQMPYAGQFYWLNWATFDVGEQRPKDYTIFVGDLASDVTDYLLQENFRRYSSVKGAEVVIDRTRGRSKGYGFVRFGDENEQIRAMTEMNGMLCSSRPMRIGPDTRKKTKVYQQSDIASRNTTLFVGGLDSTVTTKMLTHAFGQFGELVHVKIPVSNRYGFARFSNRASAERALQMLDGTFFGERRIRLSWAGNPSNKPAHLVQTPQPDPNHGYYDRDRQ